MTEQNEKKRWQDLPAADRNAAFRELSPAQRRVAIAEDAILQLEKRRYVPEDGVYLLSGGTGLPFGDLQAYIEGGGECRVCAIGALLASRARLGNDIEVDDCNVTNWFVLQELEDTFSESMLDAMEALYERGGAFLSYLQNLAGEKAMHDAMGRWRIEEPRWWWSRQRRADAAARASAYRAACKAACLDKLQVTATWNALGEMGDLERMSWVLRNVVDNGGSLRVDEVNIEE